MYVCGLLHYTSAAATKIPTQHGTMGTMQSVGAVTDRMRRSFDWLELKLAIAFAEQNAIQLRSK